MTKSSKIVIWVAVIVFILALLYTITQDDSVVPPTSDILLNTPQEPVLINDFDEFDLLIDD
jgi:hypothetical protein